MISEKDFSNEFSRTLFYFERKNMVVKIISTAQQKSEVFNTHTGNEQTAI